MIGKLMKNNLNVVIKLNTVYDEKHPDNSVMTAWIIRDKNLKKLRESNRTIYRKHIPFIFYMQNRQLPQALTPTLVYHHFRAAKNFSKLFCTRVRVLSSYQ